MPLEFDIKPLDTKLHKQLTEKINQKTKPLGALGKLERIAYQLGRVQNSLHPEVKKPTIAVFAGDHGVVQNHAVSPYPQEVTAQMVLNFLNGGAAINVFSELNGIALKIIDSGVNFEFDNHPHLNTEKIKRGTEDFTQTQAMSEKDCFKALQKGQYVATQIFESGSNTLGFGEMGIGNTSSAALLMKAFTKEPLDACVGAGTGLDKQGIENKTQVLEKAWQLHGHKTEPLEILAAFGGFEIAMMAGAMLQAGVHQMTLIIDGFISTAAFLVAYQLNPHILDYCIFAHSSGEKGHQKMLEHLQVSPLLDLGLRLGEGTGAALAIPIVAAAAAFLNRMSSFEKANVSNKNDKNQS